MGGTDISDALEAGGFGFDPFDNLHLTGDNQHLTGTTSGQTGYGGDADTLGSPDDPNPRVTGRGKSGTKTSRSSREKMGITSRGRSSKSPARKTIDDAALAAMAAQMPPRKKKEDEDKNTFLV